MTLYTFLTLLMIAILQPTPDLQTFTLYALYYSLTYIFLSILAGLALTLLAKLLNRDLPPQTLDSTAIIGTCAGLGN